MGYSIAWIAVAGKTKEEVLLALGLADTGEPDEANESPVSGAGLPGGAYLLFFNDVVHPATRPELMARLSSEGTALGCQLAEHAMVSASFQYAHGEQAWEVMHDADLGIDHLDVTGTPPVQLAEPLARMRAAHERASGADANVDYLFEVPILLAAAISGYRHDRVALASGEELLFTELVPLA